MTWLWIGVLAFVSVSLLVSVPVAQAQTASSTAQAPARLCGMVDARNPLPPADVPEALDTVAHMPGLVGLRRLLPQGEGEDAPPPPQFCGGAAVGPSAILTARHCVEGRDWLRLDVTAPASNGLRYVRRATAALCPPLSIPGRLHKDVALLLLDSPLPADIALAGVMTPSQMTRLSGEDTLMLASWPLAQLTRRSEGAQRTSLRAEGMGPYDMLVTKRLAAHRRGPCGGESGSPVYGEVAGGWALFGLLSAISRPEPVSQDRSDRCADPETRALLTPLVGFGAWIDATLAHCARHPAACQAPQTAGQDR